MGSGVVEEGWMSASGRGRSLGIGVARGMGGMVVWSFDLWREGRGVTVMSLWHGLCSWG